MAIKINFDAAGQPEAPTIVLAKRNGDKLGVLPAQSIQTTCNMNDAAEMSFNVYREVNGTKCALWDDITDFKLAYVVEYDMYFEMTVELEESVEETYKTVSLTQLGQAELSQVNLYNVQINTEDDILRDDYKIPTVLYNPEHPEASLLHRIMEKVPHYRVAHVDEGIQKIQRVFEFDGKSIYDAFQEIAEEIGCLFTFDSKTTKTGGIDRSISVYDLESRCSKCGHRGEFYDTCPKCGSTDVIDGYGKDTGIFVTSDELAEDLSLSKDVDSVKNCFKLKGGDDMMTATIRNCNPNGTDYIWYISDETKRDMSRELVDKIASYDKLYEHCYNDEEFHRQLDSGLTAKYNEIVEKCRAYLGKVKDDKGNPTDKDVADDYIIPAEVVGYRSLMKIYYNVIDIILILRSSMMPNAKLADTDAKKEAAKLTAANISPVAAQNSTTLGNMSDPTASNIVLSMAKVLVDYRYQVKVANGHLSQRGKSVERVWVGNFTVTNYSDKEDTTESQTIEVVINDDYETFVRQKLEKALAKGDDKAMSIAGLFKLELEPFKKELDKYAFNRLKSFHDACQSAIDILVEQGVADKKTWGDKPDDKNLYDHLYTPYKQKLDAIQAEMNERSKDIEAIEGTKDDKGAVVTKGLQGDIEDIVESVQKKLDFENYLGRELWLEFCSFRREDEYSNDNYVSDGLSNSELIEKANEFIEVANKEIYKSNELQTSISANLYNLLSIDRFKPITDDFEVGNYIRVMVDGIVYKPRLISYEIDYDDTDCLSVEFADNVRVASNVSSVKGVLQQASSMATSYSSVQRQAKQGEQGKEVLNDWFENGLDATNTKIIAGSEGQAQVLDDHGLLCRKYDAATGEYEPTQMKIINSTLAITDDNWESTKTAVGEYYYFDKDGQMQKGYGVNAETIVGKLIIGENLEMSNSGSNLDFGENGLSVWNDVNEVAINPNLRSLFAIYKDDQPIFSIDGNGDIVLKGKITAINGSQIGDGSGEIAGLARIAVTGEYSDLRNLPEYLKLKRGDFLYDNPSFTKSGDYNLLKNKPNLKTVATTGNYNDLTNKPTRLSDFTNDEMFIDKDVDNLTHYYDKESVDSSMSGKVDKTTLSNDYYTKVIVDDKLDDKVGHTDLAQDYYTITQVNDKLGKKLDKTVFDEHVNEANGKFENKADKTELESYYTKLQMNTMLGEKANNSDLSEVATNGGLYTSLKAPKQDAAKIMYINEDGLVSSITIDELKVLLGI